MPATRPLARIVHRPLASGLVEADESNGSGSVVVSGAGTSALNGTYRPFMSGIYTKDGLNSFPRIWRTGFPPETIRWRIFEDSEGGSLFGKYYSTTDGATPDQSGPWIQGDGGLPVPTVTAAS
jgi:hypothetical protein